MNIDINTILSQGERVTLECKKAQRNVPNSLWDTYSAFANTYGGTILLGVVEHMKEQGKPRQFEIAGVEDADKIRKDLWNTINSKEKVNANLLRDANEAGNDRLILEHYTMDDIDIPTLESYRIMFKTDNPDHVWNALGHKDFLLQLGGYTIDRKERAEGLTMAGLLMFGKGLPIRDKFDNLRMDYIDKSHLVGDQRYSDRITYDGRWENNLYNFVRMVLPKLTLDMPRPFQMEGIIRKDDTLQHKAVREAVTNMIIHSDFMLNGILKIEKYDDRIILTNPGLLKLPIEQIYQGGESKARNQRMQNMFRMIGYGENLGSGFPLILNAWNEKHWMKPELVEQSELMQVKLTLYFGNDPVNDPVKLTDRQNMILQMFHEDKTLSRERLCAKAGLSDATAKREIAYLKHIGMLKRMGSDKNGYWVVEK